MRLMLGMFCEQWLELESGQSDFKIMCHKATDLWKEDDINALVLQAWAIMNQPDVEQLCAIRNMQ